MTMCAMRRVAGGSCRHIVRPGTPRDVFSSGPCAATATDSETDADAGGVNPMSGETSYACVESHLNDADPIRSYSG
jgi:hypothetical protein